MDSLIQISKNTINGVEINSVNARELYNNLGLAKGQYSRWIQNNLIDQFLYNDDYIGVRQIVEGNEVVSHIVTLDTAKHLCMMAKTENAMKFRKYFIEFEKQGKNLINQQSQEIQLLQGMLNTISKMDNRVTELEQTRRLENCIVEFGNALKKGLMFQDTMKYQLSISIKQKQLLAIYHLRICYEPKYLHINLWGL